MSTTAGSTGTSLATVRGTIGADQGAAASLTRGTTTVAGDQMATFTNIDPHRPMDTQAPGDSIQSLRVPGSNQ